MAAVKEKVQSAQSERAYGKILPSGGSPGIASDDWYLYEYAPEKSGAAKQIHIGFSGIAQPQVKLLIKQYAAWRLGHVKPVTVRMEVSGQLSHFVQYLSARGIADPREFCAKEFQAFCWWLCKKGIRETAGYRIAHTVSGLIQTGQRLGWQVTGEKAAFNPMLWQFWMEAVEGDDAGYTEPIPDRIYEQILYHAVHDETDVITKAGILIQSQTGLRISEVLSLQRDCLKPGKCEGFSLAYRLKKTEKAEPVRRFVPANELVCGAVEELRQATGKLRAESGREELFLVKNHGIRPASAANWNRGRLRSFLKRWDITDADGSEYRLHSHQFRATYVKRQLLKGEHIETVQRQFGHVSPEMTARYVHLPQEEILAFLSPHMGRQASAFDVYTGKNRAQNAPDADTGKKGGDEVGEKEYAGR